MVGKKIEIDLFQVNIFPKPNSVVTFPYYDNHVFVELTKQEVEKSQRIKIEELKSKFKL